MFGNSIVNATETKYAGIEKIDLSFEQAYELMLVNNNALKASTEAIKQSKYEKNAALGEFFPKIGLNTSYVHFDNPINVTTTVPMMGSLTTNLQQENLFTASGGVVWNIFTGGKILALNSAARAKYEATNEKYRAVKDELTVELVKRYYGLRLARDVVEVRAQYRDGVKKHLEDAKKLEKAGLIAKSERLHAEVAYEQAERNFKASVRDANVLEEGLKNLIKEESVDLKNVSINPQSLLFMYNKDFKSLEELKKLAMENNPMLKQVEAKKKIANAKFRGEVANYSPTLTLFAYDIFGANDLSHQVPRWAVGGSVNFMVFDGFSRYNKVRAADAGRNQVKYEIIDAQYNIESLVTKQYQELMKYSEQYKSTDKSIESAQEALRTANLGFREGLKTSLDVIDAQLALSGVKIERLKALYDYDLTMSEILKTTGNTSEILEYISNSDIECLNGGN